MAIDVKQLRKDKKTLTKEEFEKKYEQLKGLSDAEIGKVAGGARIINEDGTSTNLYPSSRG